MNSQQNTLKFNKIFVIESLNELLEKQTGKELYDDLLKWEEVKSDSKLKAELLQVSDRSEFFKSLNHIFEECKSLSRFPILHIEIHGNKNGLVLKSGELITWEELYSDLVKINSIIGNNLLLTLAVCHGAYIKSITNPLNSAPFYGFIGSFNELDVNDLMIRFYEFYKTFLSTFNFKDSMTKLIEANPDAPIRFRYISSEDTFNEVYADYLKNDFTEARLQERVENLILREEKNFVSRQEKRKYKRDFIKGLKETKGLYRQEHLKKFFMLENFPENRERFNITRN